MLACHSPFEISDLVSLIPNTVHYSIDPIPDKAQTDFMVIGYDEFSHDAIVDALSHSRQTQAFLSHKCFLDLALFGF